MNLTDRERATILAALLYWREEMCPHGPGIARHYFRSLKLGKVKALSAQEIDKLMARLKRNAAA